MRKNTKPSDATARRLRRTGLLTLFMLIPVAVLIFAPRRAYMQSGTFEIGTDEVGHPVEEPDEVVLSLLSIGGEWQSLVHLRDPSAKLTASRHPIRPTALLLRVTSKTVEGAGQVTRDLGKVLVSRFSKQSEQANIQLQENERSFKNIVDQLQRRSGDPLYLYFSLSAQKELRAIRVAAREHRATSLILDEIQDETPDLARRCIELAIATVFLFMVALTGAKLIDRASP